MSLSSVLFENASKSVMLLDLPRSIEEGQVLSSQLEQEQTTNVETAIAKNQNQVKLRTLVSAPPPAAPFPTPEPKSGGGYRQPQSSAGSHAAQVAELMTLAAVESAVDEIAQSYDGPWCLPRHCRPPLSSPSSSSAQKQQQQQIPPPPLAENQPATKSQSHTQPISHQPESSDSTPPSPPPPPPPPPPPDLTQYHIPPSSHHLLGTIATHRPIFLSSTTPSQFNLIVLDPPWPNRSAKRKRRHSNSNNNHYQPVSDLSSMRSLLSLIPVASHLAPGGLVAVWVTNAARFSDLLLAPGSGIFSEWLVELVGEWTWLKVTAEGEPVVSPHSAWRKPWERLLIARRRGDGGEKMPVKGKVIVAVPDVHSRKPCLRGLFEEYMPPGGYQALEVFARSLTAGWWGWGNQALLYQHKDHWVDVDAADVNVDVGVDADATAEGESSLKTPAS